MKILIVTPWPNGGGAWGYKGYADKLQFGGNSPKEAVQSAYDRGLVDLKDDIHLCTDVGIKVMKANDFNIRFNRTGY
jgi:hypothetical protein